MFWQSATEGKENYTSKDSAATLNINYVKGTAHNLTDPTKGTIDTEDVYTSYLNTRQGTIPTGVILLIPALHDRRMRGYRRRCVCYHREEKEERITFFE